MKKILLATAAVALTAGAAAANDGITMTGFGRIGVVYSNNAGWNNSTQITSRFRLDIAAIKTTDSGIEFGGKFRMQSDQAYGAPDIKANANNLGAAPNSANFWVTAGGFTLQVGNVSDAIDSSGVYYNGDLGLLGAGDQEVLGATGFIGYDTNPFSDNGVHAKDYQRVGLLGEYSAYGLKVNISYINNNQTDPDNAAGGDEGAITVDYTAGAFAIGAGYVKNPGFGLVGDKETAAGEASFLSGQYTFGKSTVGLQVGDNGKRADTAGNKTGTMYTLFGNTDLGNGMGLQGYVTKDDNDTHDTGVGIGMSYDIGGATLLGSIAKMRNKDTQADFGVKFSF